MPANCEELREAQNQIFVFGARREWDGLLFDSAFHRLLCELLQLRDLQQRRILQSALYAWRTRTFSRAYEAPLRPDRPFDTTAVDSRTTNSGSTCNTEGTCARGSAMRFTNVSAARMPICNSGCRIVVRAGM